jgi:hypothetical protein
LFKLCCDGSHVVHVFDVQYCTGHEKVHDGPRKRGRKPLDKPYVDTCTSDEKTVAWHFVRAVAFQYAVSAHTSVWARHHNVGGIDVRPPVMQLCPWGNQVAQFVTIDTASLKALATTLGVPVGEADVPGFGKLGPFMIAAGWQAVKFVKNMWNRIAHGRFALPPPRSIRTDGYQIQVCGFVVF